LQSKKRLDPVTDAVQFNILEPPFASELPAAPNRPLFLWGVLIFALGTGGAAAFGMNQLKPVFFTRRSVTKIAGLPVLGSVSKIMSPDVIATNKRKAILWAGVNAGLLIITVFVVEYERPASLALRTLLRESGI
jgi:hypothetical protein